MTHPPIIQRPTPKTYLDQVDRVPEPGQHFSINLITDLKRGHSSIWNTVIVLKTMTGFQTRK